MLKDAISVDSHTERVNECLVRAATLITSHRLSEAIEEIERALSIDFESPDVVASLKYTSFWKDRQERVAVLPEPFEQGEYLLAQWAVFQDFVQRIDRPVELLINALRQHVFGQALGYYRAVYQDLANRDAELLVRIARCYKGSGDYERARRFLQAAATNRPDDAEILAELADILAMVNETSLAKAFLREAFFIDAQKIDIARLESELIQRLVRAVANRGIEGPALLEWIPVYGFLFGVLNVKREIRSIEFGRLKQSIYELERELREGTGDAELIRPRLINRYFWLIDHYVAVKESQGKVEEVLLKIRSVDDDVYHQYNA